MVSQPPAGQHGHFGSAGFSPGNTTSTGDLAGQWCSSRTASRSSSSAVLCWRCSSSASWRATHMRRPGPISAGIRSAVIITVDRPGEVDELARAARAAGATVTKEPTDAEFFEGRDACFADPEGNYWEIAWTPGTNPVVAAGRRPAGQPT